MKQCKDCYQEKQLELAVTYEEARGGQVVCSEKECTKCGHTRSVEYFVRHWRKKTGLDGQCLICIFIPSMVHQAKRQNHIRIMNGREMPEVTVTPDYISGLPTTCALSGVELAFCSGHIHKASLDRIVDSNGYVDGNVRLVDIRFNTRAKWTLEKYQEAFGSGWKQFVETRGKSMKSKSPETEINGFTLRSKLVNLGFLYTNEGRSPKLIKDLWDRQGGRCYYSNIPMSWGHIDYSDWTVSVERLHQGLYTPENTVLVCAEFNSTEYVTDRFEHLFDGEPQGWNQAVVNWYRTRDEPKSSDDESNVSKEEAEEVAIDDAAGEPWRE